MIKTERIKIYPASREQMERIIQAEKDDELKKAYGEMLEGCLTHPDQWDWYAMWMIEKTDPDNAASQRVLMKCGFEVSGEIGEEGPRFIVYKE